jgi:hypothetical protein
MGSPSSLLAIHLLRGNTNFLPRLRVLIDAQLPGGAQGAFQYIFAHSGQPDMRRTISSSAAVDGQKHFRQLFHECSLLLGRQH